MMRENRLDPIRGRHLTIDNSDPGAHTRYLEWDIDRLVYDPYGLTEEEDTAIERSLGLIHATDEMETLRNPYGG